MAKREFSLGRKIGMFLVAMIGLPLINILSILIPYQKIYSFSKFIGRFLATSKKKAIIDKNLSIMGIKLPDEELQDVYYVVSGYVIRIVLEMIAFSRMDFQEFMSYVRIKQHDQFSKIYNHEGSSICCTLHCGNWEMLGSFMNSVGVPLACVVERQFNPWIDRYIQHLRNKIGMMTIYNEISEMRPLLRYMKSGGSVALVSDQTYWFDPMFIPFFGQEVAVPSGTATLAIKTESPLSYFSSQFIKEGAYSIHIDTDSIHKSSDVGQLMKNIYTEYEKTISQDVSNWYTLGSDRWGLTRESLKEWEKNPDSSRF